MFVGKYDSGLNFISRMRDIRIYNLAKSDGAIAAIHAGDYDAAGIVAHYPCNEESGTTGYDYATMSISDDLVEQTGQCLRNIEEALRHAGCSLDQVVRVHYIVAPGQDFSLCWPLLKKAFDQARPAATMWHAELANSQMKIEIEVTAYLGEGV